MIMRCRWSARRLTAPGYHHGARGIDCCGMRKVSHTRQVSLTLSRYDADIPRVNFQFHHLVLPSIMYELTRSDMILCTL